MYETAGMMGGGERECDKEREMRGLETEGVRVRKVARGAVIIDRI